MPRPVASPPPSLVHLFEPPQGFVGRFGWLCGYSAGADFLELAAERFTHLTAPRRAFNGTVVLGLLLDPGQPQIAPVDVPGLLHLPMRSPANRQFALLHAKVALLGFRHEKDATSWRLRVIVSTGNWTQQTLEESLDLAWSVDLDRSALNEPTPAIRQAQSDIAAASNFLGYVREHFDTLVLEHGARGNAESGPHELDAWVSAAVADAPKRASRFFDNRRASLLQQLPAQVGHACGKDLARNYLAMGSGFYEGAEERRARPTVPERIVELLQGGSGSAVLLTTKPEVNLFVNPLACQGMAVFARKLPQRWSLHRPFRSDCPPWRRGTLHAKFIFSANWRQDAEYCASAWLYLGSGNLTNPGFANAAHRERGNLEAGVVTSVEGVRWAELADRLPMDELNGSSSLAVEQVAQGLEMEERPDAFSAAPVSFLQARREGESCWLVAPSEPVLPFAVLQPTGEPSVYEPGRGCSWSGTPPRQVRVRWSELGKTWEADVPVVDEFGRIAGLVLQKLNLDDAWSQLADFPLPPPDEDLLDRDDGPSTEESAVRTAATGAPSSRYATREIMTLVENIATLQERLDASDWRAWCRRFEQTLTLARESEGAQLCRAFSMNLLSPLRRAEFRPTFAEDASTTEGQLYEEALRNVELAWGVRELPELGVRA
jgi:hypothetical protein